VKSRSRSFLIGLSLTLPVLLNGQQPTVAPSALLSANSPTVLYHLIRSAAAVDRTAQTMDAADHSGADLRNALSSTLGLTDLDFQVFLGLVRSYDKQFSALDQRAAQIVEAAHARVLKGELLPPPPAELDQLQAQKTAFMEALPYSLEHSAITDAGKAALQAYASRAASKTTLIDPQTGVAK
jgi:hypothetical protein